MKVEQNTTNYNMEKRTVRIQFTDTELKTLVYHLDNELESLTDVIRDLQGRPEEDKEHLDTIREYETLNKVQRKLIKSIRRLSDKK